jgi:hypothetical protein
LAVSRRQAHRPRLSFRRKAATGLSLGDTFYPRSS